MANIPVEKKSGLGWLWLILGLLLAALILWWLLSDGDDDVEQPVTTDPVVQTTDTAAVGTAGALAVGETFSIQNARVTELTGDMSFRVDDNGTERFVVFNQTPTPNMAQEGEFDINPGQLVNLSGTVMSSDQPLPEGVDATIPTGTTQYLFADSMEVAERP